jgi:hypothetical protein
VQVVGRDETRVRGNQIAGPEVNDVARHDVAPGTLYPSAIASHGRGWRNLFLKTRHGALRAKGLPHIEAGAQEHDAGDDERLRGLAQESGRGASNQQDDHQRVRRSTNELRQLRFQPRDLKLIRTEGLQASCRLTGVESLVRRLKTNEEIAD